MYIPISVTYTAAKQPTKHIATTIVASILCIIFVFVCFCLVTVTLVNKLYPSFFPVVAYDLPRSVAKLLLVFLRRDWRSLLD